MAVGYVNTDAPPSRCRSIRWRMRIDLNPRQHNHNHNVRMAAMERYPNQQPSEKRFKTESSSEKSLASNSDVESDSTLSNNEIQTPDYTSIDEGSVNSDEDLLNSKVKMPCLEPKKVFSPNLVIKNKIPVGAQKTIYTGYKLWSTEMKREILKKYPNIDLTIMTIRLGEMWTKMSVNNRNAWHNRAQMLTEKEAIQNKSVLDFDKTDWLNSCNNNSSQVYSLKQSYHEIKLRTIELQPIDVAAHLTLLGESLILIGARLKQHDKPIIISDCITVLLDSLLCAMGSLICLTQQETVFNVNSPLTFVKILENIAYIMPGL